MEQHSKTLSVIIPLFNESKRIARNLPVIETKLEALERNYNMAVELILVNDGSTDSTEKIIREDSHFHTVHVITIMSNKGKGFALKKGFERAIGDHILFIDADLSTPLEHIETFIQAMSDDETILIGTRKVTNGLVKVNQPFLRRKLGQGFTFLSNVLLGTSVSDFTCGFKMFPRDAGKRIFDHVTIDRWGFDAEVIFLAKHFRYQLREIPVTWHNDFDSKVRLVRDVLGSLRDMVRIKLNTYQNVYDRS